MTMAKVIGFLMATSPIWLMFAIIAHYENLRVAVEIFGGTFLILFVMLAGLELMNKSEKSNTVSAESKSSQSS